MVPIVKAPKMEGQSQLSSMQLVKGLKKGKPPFMSIIACVGEDNGAQGTFPPYKRGD